MSTCVSLGLIGLLELLGLLGFSESIEFIEFARFIELQEMTARQPRQRLMAGGGPTDCLFFPEKVDNSQGGSQVDQGKIVRDYEQSISHT